jgi:hypothetical protein
MEARNLTQKDLWKTFGSKGITSEVFHGKRAISKAQAKKLARFESTPNQHQKQKQVPHPPGKGGGFGMTSRDGRLSDCPPSNFWFSRTNDLADRCVFNPAMQSCVELAGSACGLVDGAVEDGGDLRYFSYQLG